MLRGARSWALACRIAVLHESHLSSMAVGWSEQLEGARKFYREMKPSRKQEHTTHISTHNKHRHEKAKGMNGFKLPKGKKANKKNPNKENSYSPA